MPLTPGIAAVLCARPADLPPGMILTPGSGTLRCVGCGTKVVVARSTKAHIAEGTMQPVCRGCLPERYGNPSLTVEQARELVSWLGHDPSVN